MDVQESAPETLQLIDIGVNLTNKAFAGDLDAVIARARAAGVGRMLVTGTDFDGSAAAQLMSAEQPGVLYATAGVHPHHASDWGKGAETALEALCRRPSVVALGECGLDFNRDFSPRPAQRLAFEAQLDLAGALGLPVFLHQRDAHDEFLRLLARYRDRLDGAVVHCFTGEREELAAYLDHDLHIGITGWICDERRGMHLRELVPRIPAGRLLLETDAPYLLPRDLRPKPRSHRNEPAHLPHICRVVAACRDEPAAALAAASTAAADGLFRLAGR